MPALLFEQAPMLSESDVTEVEWASRPRQARRWPAGRVVCLVLLVGVVLAIFAGRFGGSKQDVWKSRTLPRTHFLAEILPADDSVFVSIGATEGEALAARADELLSEAQSFKANESIAVDDTGSQQSTTNTPIALSASEAKSDPAATRTAKEQATVNLLEEAKLMQERAEADMNASSVALILASDQLGAAEGKVQSLDLVIEVAKSNISQAQDAVLASEALIEDSKAIQQRSRQAFTEGGQASLKGKKEADEGSARVPEAVAEAADVQKQIVAVSLVEQKALDASASHRTCVDLPGARLRQLGTASPFDPLALTKDAGSPSSCRDWCKKHESCVQSVFLSSSQECFMFERATVEVQEWSDNFQSSFCGDVAQQALLMDMLDRVFAQKPTVPEVVPCSWAGEDCTTTSCCNDVACTWDFKTCSPYTCYKSDGPGQCKETASWNVGSPQGAGRPARKTEAGKSTTLHGTSLFCFMVVLWSSQEAAIANNIQDKQLSIFGCDAHTILNGVETPKTPWATYVNADAFSKLWQQVQLDGQYLQHDWTVKVDADTVFFPNILKMHVAALRIPQGSRVYLKNANFKFQFLGSLEVVSREAVVAYMQNSGVCAEKLLSQTNPAEDWYMKTCLDASGVDSIEDFELLHDSVCEGACPDSKGPCSNGWVAAYHAFKDPDAWNKCHDEATGAQTVTLPEPVEVVEEKVPAVDGRERRSAVSLMREAETSFATVKIFQSQTLEHLSTEAMLDATATKEQTLASVSDIERQVEAAKRQIELAMKELHQAAASEMKHLDEISRQRVCISLPGVRLSGAAPLDLPPIAVNWDTHTEATCIQWCRGHEGCRQAVFSSEKNECSLFGSSSERPITFVDTFNSSYCGAWQDQQSLLDALGRVFTMKPYVPPLPNCAWAGDNCMESKCCANLPMANWKFTEFQWYTCYKRDENWAGCMTGPAPGDWNGTRLGGMSTREVPKAPDGVLVQGTSLFCFSVVTWDRPAKAAFWNSEAELADHMKTRNLSIFQCDDNAFFSGQHLNSGGDPSSINNIDSFIFAWNAVRDDGRYLQHDWTVKVDTDAVFFPDRLKNHLLDLRTPQGSRVYLRNIDFKFQFLGALEVFTKEALQLYFERQDVCATKVGHEGGEDYYMKGCLEGIGVDYQTDVKLLNDKYAATGNCNDPWVAGFHFYKQIAHWDDCYNAAVQSR